MTKSKKVSVVGKKLRGYADTFGINIKRSVGLTDENYHDAVLLVDELAAAVRRVPAATHKVVDTARSPQTGLLLLMSWSRSRDTRGC